MAIAGDSAFISCFSCIDSTILSSFRGDIRRCRSRRGIDWEGLRWRCGSFCTGAVRERGPEPVFDSSSDSSDEAESTLPDKQGISAFLGLDARSTGKADREGNDGVQKSVSRVIILQLRFSSRLPSSRESAHLENTTLC